MWQEYQRYVAAVRAKAPPELDGMVVIKPTIAI